MSNGTDTPQIAANNAHLIIFDPTVIISGQSTIVSKESGRVSQIFSPGRGGLGNTRK